MQYLSNLKSTKFTSAFLATSLALLAYDHTAAHAQEKADEELPSISHKTKFVVQAGGIDVGEMSFIIKSDRKTYTLKGSGKTKGIAKWFSSGNAKLESAGSLLGDRLDAQSHFIKVTDGKKTESLSMNFSGGSITDLQMKPDKSKKHLKDKYYTIAERDFLNIIDPASTLVLPVPYEKATDPKAACNHLHRVYDGETRYDMQLSYKKRAKIKTKGYNGNVYVCRLNYIPVSGHKKSNKNIKRMAKSNDMEIWIAPMQATNVFTPIRINIPTWIGRFTAEPTYFGPAN
ncbi:MAG: DUF3108 domain-containing protein [Nitratireductor sp.]